MQLQFLIPSLCARQVHKNPLFVTVHVPKTPFLRLCLHLRPPFRVVPTPRTTYVPGHTRTSTCIYSSAPPQLITSPLCGGCTCIYTENIPSPHNCFVTIFRWRSLIIPTFFLNFRHFHDESEVSFTDNEENIFEITDHGSMQITVHED